MDIQELEKAVQKNDLKAVSQIMGREIMKLRDEVELLNHAFQAGVWILVIAAAASTLILAVARHLGC